MLDKELLDYFKGDELAAGVWLGKYALPDEKTPDAMHRRLAKRFNDVEHVYIGKELFSVKGLPNHRHKNLSAYGTKRDNLSEESIYQLFKDFKYIVPQGSIMSQLGANSIGSLSNCFVIGNPEDSYGGIFQKDEEMVQLMKRRGGVGIDLSTLRPAETVVSNAAKTTTGAVSFMHRYSNSTREVAQNGRRGALMLSIHINHPDVLEFIKIKRDLSQVTGANISVKISKEFMKAVEADEDFILRFPCDSKFEDVALMCPADFEGEKKDLLSYNSLTSTVDNVYLKKVKAREYWDEIIKSAHGFAEPGIIFVDNHHEGSPDGAYPQFKGVTTNPCFHPDSIVETEFGPMKIKDMDKPMRVYSMDSDGRLVMANASTSFISKKDAQTYKVTLRNGNSISLTENHKLYLHDKGWVEVKDIRYGDKIAHLCRSRRGAKYAGVHLTTSPNKQRDQVMEHKLVYGPHEAEYNVHHLDRNTYNNSINNLELLSHSEHSRVTATEDNPQNHQVRDEKGMFISGEDSKKGKKMIVDLPEDLKTNLISQWHNTVVSIEKDIIIDVYDIQVEDTHCLVVNNMVAHNCGEIFMQPYDACRLIAVNLLSFVNKPYTKDAEFDVTKFYEVNYEAMRLSDDLIDLELGHIDRILEKIQEDKESQEVKEREYRLWQKVRTTALSSRRTGLGFTALGDCMAALGIGYDSEEGLLFVEQFMHIKMESELDCTIDLAILRGPFKGWDQSTELIPTTNEIGTTYRYANKFYEDLSTNFPVQAGRMYHYGRRNVSWNTVAPTGTVSLLTQTTSGLEPIFQPFYIRRKKVNPGSDVRVDFTDQNGDTWQEFPVIHEQFKEWILTRCPDFEAEGTDKAELKDLFERSPWFGSTANDIDWKKRVEIQGIIQKYITHSISSTINLPNSVTEEEVSEIYMHSWKEGLKGVTVYRDGSRSGVLVTEPTKELVTFHENHAPKRPKSLPCKVIRFNNNYEKWIAFVGLLDNKPYEVFTGKADSVDLPISIEVGEIKKVKSEDGKKRYDFVFDGGTIEGISGISSPDYWNYGKLISGMLRHGMPLPFVIDTIQNLTWDSEHINTWKAGMARALKKFIKDGKIDGIKCKECEGTNVVFEEGCSKCLDCGSSACG